MYCPACNALLKPGSGYCVQCGASVQPEAVAAGTAAGKPNPYGAPSAWNDPHFAPEAVDPHLYPTTSVMAIVSLVAGILAWLMFPAIGALVAVIAGHMARGEIRSSGGRIVGDDLAKAGLILGYIQIGLVVALIGIVAVIGILAVVLAAR